MRKEAPINKTYFSHKRSKWNSFCDFLRDAPLNEIPNIPIENCDMVSSAVKTDIDNHVLSQKYQEEPQASPWFTSICSAASAAE